MSINYIEQDKLQISFSCLIIKISSITKIVGDFNSFTEQNKLWGKANKKLYILSEMNEPAWGLSKLLDNLFLPLGLIEERDYVITFEQLIRGAGNSITPLIHQGLPGCKDILWLGSIIDYDGNWVWLKDEKITSN